MRVSNNIPISDPTEALCVMKVVVRMSCVLVETDVHLKKMWAVRVRHHLVFLHPHVWYVQVHLGKGCTCIVQRQPHPSLP